MIGCMHGKTCSEKGMPPVYLDLAPIFWYCYVTPFKSQQNELCNVLNLPIGLQLSWQSGFCPRHDVFTPFCEIKCKRSGVSGTNDKVHSDVQNSNRVRLDLTT